MDPSSAIIKEEKRQKAQSNVFQLAHGLPSRSQKQPADSQRQNCQQCGHLVISLLLATGPLLKLPILICQYYSTPRLQIHEKRFTSSLQFPNVRTSSGGVCQ